MSDVGQCKTCGAPFKDGLAECMYCDTRIEGRAGGVDCPSCGELATSDRRTCAACGASFARGCIFCGHASFITAPACTSCGEAFEGAQERKTQREAAAKQQQMMGLAAQGISMLGQAAGTPGGRDLLGSVLDAVIHSGDPKRR
jgi:hypothetical protein